MRRIAALLLCAALAGAQGVDLEAFAEQFEKVVAAGGLRAILDQMPAEAEARLSDEPAGPARHGRDRR
jgi:signal recognition particle GTPase